MYHCIVCQIILCDGHNVRNSLQDRTLSKFRGGGGGGGGGDDALLCFINKDV